MTRRRWLVTGTPFTGSCAKLEKQARFLGHWNGAGAPTPSKQGGSSSSSSSSSSSGSKSGGGSRSQLSALRQQQVVESMVAGPEGENLRKFAELIDGSSKTIEKHDAPASRRRVEAYQGMVAALRRVMVRHTKTQRIGGGAALALPTLNSETIFLTMTADEREAYNAMCKLERGTGKYLNAVKRGTTSFGFEMALIMHRQSCANVYGFKFLINAHQAKARYVASNDRFGNVRYDTSYVLPSGVALPGNSTWEGAAATLKLVTNPNARRSGKIDALIKDLRQLRAKEPHLHAVVL